MTLFVNAIGCGLYCLAGTVVPGRDIELAFRSGVACVCVCQLCLLTKYLENHYAYDDVTWGEVAGGDPLDHINFSTQNMLIK